MGPLPVITGFITPITRPSYLIIRPFIGVITPFITGRGPTLWDTGDTINPPVMGLYCPVTSGISNPATKQQKP